jgi:hypothetical protein
MQFSLWTREHGEVPDLETAEHELGAKLVPTLADRGCRVVSATDPHGR